MNMNKICIFDLETSSPNPQTCDPVQLAALMIDPRTLKIIKNSEFNSYIQPPTIKEPEKDYFKENRKTIEWHARNMNINPLEVMDIWNNAPLEKDVFNQFVSYLNKYHTKTTNRSKFSAPILGGYNIIRFDLIILKRLCKKYGQVDNRNDIKIIHPRDKIDGMNLSFYFFENLKEPTSYSMDYLRPYLGMSVKGAHSADKDIQDTALLIIEFIKLCRRAADNTKFRNFFKEKK